ncbi:hypothetical protein [Kribbella sp. NPDC055071]
MTTPNEDRDLHGRQLILLLVFFGGVTGGLYLLGPSFLAGNPVGSAAVAGMACYPARFLVGRFDWWTRLEQPTRRTIARRERARQRLLDREAADRLLPPDHTGGSRHRRPARGRPRWISSVRKLIGGRSDDKPE